MLFNTALLACDCWVGGRRNAFVQTIIVFEEFEVKKPRKKINSVLQIKKQTVYYTDA